MFGISAKAGAPKGTNLGEAPSSVAEGLMRVWKKPSECSCSSPAVRISAISQVEYEQQKIIFRNYKTKLLCCTCCFSNMILAQAYPTIY